MVTIDVTSVAAVALVVTMTGLMYYHLVFFYSVKQRVFGNVRSALENLWTDRIVANNATYFNADLPKTIAIVKAYEDSVHGYVQRSLGILDTDEQACNRQSEISLTVYEVLLVVGLMITLIVGVSLDSLLNAQ